MRRALGRLELTVCRAAALLLAWAICWMAGPAWACTVPAVVVNVHGVRSDSGLVAALIYDDNPDNFLKNGRKLHRVREPASKGSTRVCLPSPAPGRYAIAVFHDENANKRLDQGFLGIPEEGYGFSNNPGFTFGLPEMDDILIDIRDEGVEIDVDLRYLIGDSAPRN